MSMFTRCTKQEYEALYRLNGPELQVLLGLFKKQLAETDKGLRCAVDTHTLRLQGRAQYLEELIETATTAAAIIERMR